MGMGVGGNQINWLPQKIAESENTTRRDNDKRQEKKRCRRNEKQTKLTTSIHIQYNSHKRNDDTHTQVTRHDKKSTRRKRTQTQLT